MAFGGSGVGPPAAAGGPSAIRQVKLDKECELRIEVGPDAPLRLRLLTGTAEIFGTEIAPEIWLTFPPRLKFALVVELYEIDVSVRAVDCVVGLKMSPSRRVFWAYKRHVAGYSGSFTNFD